MGGIINDSNLKFALFDLNTEKCSTKNNKLENEGEVVHQRGRIILERKNFKSWDDPYKVTRDENLIVKNMVFLSVIEKTRVIKPQLKIIKFKIKTITSSFI